MNASPEILSRLDQLIATGDIPLRRSQYDGKKYLDTADWKQWFTSALNLCKFAFGENSIYYQQLVVADVAFRGYETTSRTGVSILVAAKADLSGRVIGSLEQRLLGEIFADFLTLAKNALHEGHKDVAAVLACAALEDTLKKFALLNGLDVENKALDNIVGALKGAGHFSGAAKNLVGVMPKIRNHAMHAEWDKISEYDVGGVIGFTEQFLLSKMS